VCFFMGCWMYDQNTRESGTSLSMHIITCAYCVEMLGRCVDGQPSVFLNVEQHCSRYRTRLLSLKKNFAGRMSAHEYRNCLDGWNVDTAVVYSVLPYVPSD
jgi:hypothetical protein